MVYSNLQVMEPGSSGDTASAGTNFNDWIRVSGKAGDLEISCCCQEGIGLVGSGVETVDQKLAWLAEEVVAAVDQEQAM